MHIKDSDNERIFGHGGNGSGAYGDRENHDPATIDDAKKGPLFKLENATNFIITNLSDQLNAGPMKTTVFGAVNTSYKLYYPLQDDSLTVTSDERPVMYKKGNPVGAPAKVAFGPGC
jgi:hypothetical protein